MAFGDTVQSAGDRQTSNVADITVTLGATPTDGNLLVATVCARNLDGLDTPSGWSLAEFLVSNSHDQAMFYKIASSDGTGYTFDITGAATAEMAAIVAEIEGAFDGTPLDKTAEDSSGVTEVDSMSTGTTAATAQADEIAVAGVFVIRDPGTVVGGWTNSFVEIAEEFDTTGGTDINTAMSSKLLSSTQTVETTAGTWATGRRSGACVATFKAALGAGSASPGVIARSFTVDAVTTVGPAVDVQDVIARSFTVDAATAKGAAVDVQNVIARSFGIGATTQVGAAVDVQDLIALDFALDQVTLSNTDAGAGTASPAVIARLFTVDAATPRGAGVDVQALIARSFGLGAVTVAGAGVDVQDLIALAFTVDAVTLVGPGVDVQDLIARAFALDQVTLSNTDGTPGTATPAAIVRAFALGAPTLVGGAVDVQDVIARSFGLGAVTVAGAGVDVQDLIARSFTVDAVTLVGGGVQTAPLIALSFALDAVTLSNSDVAIGARIVAVSVIERPRVSAISRRRVKVTDRNRVT